MARRASDSSRLKQFALMAYASAVQCLDHLDDFRPTIIRGKPTNLRDDDGTRAEAFALTMVEWARLRRKQDEDPKSWWQMVQAARRTYRPDAPSCAFCELPGSPTLIENIAKLLGLKLRQLIHSEDRPDPLAVKDLREMKRQFIEDWKGMDAELREAVLTILAATFREPEDLATQLIRESAATGLIDIVPGTSEVARGRKPRGAGRRKSGKRRRAPTEIELQTFLTMQRVGNNMSAAARLLGVDRTTVRENWKRAQAVLANVVEVQGRSVRAVRLPTDARDQVTAASEDETAGE